MPGVGKSSADLPALLGCNDWDKVPKNQLLSRPAVSSDKNSLPAEWAVIVSEQKTWSQSSAALFDPLCCKKSLLWICCT